MQRALMHYFKPYNRPLVIKALKKAGREDLIGWGPECLIAPREIAPKDRGKPPREAPTKDRGKPRAKAAPKSAPRRESAPRRKHPDKGKAGRRG